MRNSISRWMLVAGKNRLIPSPQFIRNSEGSTCLSLQERRKINYGVTKELCEQAEPLTEDEFNYLCGQTLTALVDIMDLLEISEFDEVRLFSSKVSDRSSELKKYFWDKMTGQGKIIKHDI